MSARGGAPAQLTRLGTHVWSSTWAPSATIVFAANPRSDSGIAFQSERAGGWELFALDPVSGRVERVTTNAYDDMSPAWDPGARKVAFVSHEAGEWRLKVLDWQTREVTTVLASERYLDHPAWRPDGGSLWVTRGTSREFDGYFNDLEIVEVPLSARTGRPSNSLGQAGAAPPGDGR